MGHAGHGLAEGFGSIQLGDGLLGGPERASLTQQAHWPRRLEVWAYWGLSTEVPHVTSPANQSQDIQTPDMAVEGTSRGSQWTAMEAASLLRLGSQLAQHPFCWNPLVIVVLDPTQIQGLGTQTHTSH